MSSLWGLCCLRLSAPYWQPGCCAPGGASRQVRKLRYIAAKLWNKTSDSSALWKRCEMCTQRCIFLRFARNPHITWNYVPWHSILIAPVACPDLSLALSNTTSVTKFWGIFSNKEWMAPAPGIYSLFDNRGICVGDSLVLIWTQRLTTFEMVPAHVCMGPMVHTLYDYWHNWLHLFSVSFK